MKKYLLNTITVLMLAACGNQTTKTEKVNHDLAFDQFKDRFVDALWKQYPSWASSVGFHNV
jgi:hypothetical protein